MTECVLEHQAASRHLQAPALWAILAWTRAYLLTYLLMLIKKLDLNKQKQAYIDIIRDIEPVMHLDK